MPRKPNHFAATEDNPARTYLCKGRLLAALGLSLPLLGHCNFHCGSNPANKIKLPIQSEKSGEEVQDAVLQSLPEIKKRLAGDLKESFPDFDLTSTKGTWFSVSRAQATIRGKHHDYCELIINIEYSGQKPDLAALRKVMEDSARKALEAEGWKVVRANEMGFPVFESGDNTR